jgi:hypothetical protein
VASQLGEAGRKESPMKARGRTRYRRLLVAGASVVLALSFGSAVASSGPQVLPPNGKHFGKTYAGWSAEWWQWALALPVHTPPGSTRVTHPLVDLTGAWCGKGQSGRVWFLGGAFFESGTAASSTIVRDKCTVPVGKALFVPLLNVECTEAEGSANGCGSTVEGSREVVAFFGDRMAHLAADVDGAPITITSAFRVGSPDKRSFCVDIARDDVLSWIGETLSPGRSCDTVDDGYYVLLAPLSPGRHVVHFHGEIPEFNFTLDVTYNLMVGKEDSDH